jgi:hypothetical protein
VKKAPWLAIALGICGILIYVLLWSILPFNLFGDLSRNERAVLLPYIVEAEIFLSCAMAISGLIWFFIFPKTSGFRYSTLGLFLVPISLETFFWVFLIILVYRHTYFSS